MLRRILCTFAILLTMVACTTKQAETTVGNTEISSEVAFEVAKNYFFKNNQEIPASPKITSEEVFYQLFGMATTMGKDGKPTAIDFTRQIVLAIVLPVTDLETEITPVKVEAKGDSLFYTYEVKTGEKQSYSIQPISLIVLNKEFSNKEIILIKQ